MTAGTPTAVLKGRDTNGDPSANTVRLIGLSSVTRTLGLLGDSLTVNADAGQWVPVDWDLSYTVSIEFGDDVAGTIELGGYVVRDARPIVYGVDPDDVPGGSIPQLIQVALTTWPGVHRDGRGGRLTSGTLNPLGEDGVPDPADDNYKINSELIDDCMVAMDITGTVAATVDDITPGGPYDWGNAHAMAELEALLRRIGHAAAVSLDGNTMDVVRLPLAGETTTIPSSITDEAEPFELVSAPATRGSTIVVTSDRTRSVVIAKRTMADLEWVWFDERTGRWLNDSETAALYPDEISPGDIDAFRLGPGRSVEEREQFARLFRALRLTGDDLVTRSRFRTLGKDYELADGTKIGGTGAVVLSRHAVPVEFGQFVNQPESSSGELVRVGGATAIMEEGVFVLPTGPAFVRMPSASVSGTFADAELLGDDELEVYFLHEAVLGAAGSIESMIESYYVKGWSASVNAGSIELTELTDEDLEDAVANPATVVVGAPFLTRVLEDDGAEVTPLNDTELDAIALKIAEVRAASDQAQTGDIVMRGLHAVTPGDAGGAVSSVTWNIPGRRTILRINDHEVPESVFEALQLSAGASVAAGLRRFDLPGSSAALSDVRGGSTPGQDGSGGGSATGDAQSGSAGRGKTRSAGTKTAHRSPAPVAPDVKPILALLGPSDPIGTNRWAYDWVQVRLASTEPFYSIADDAPNSETLGRALNGAELANGSAGAQGSGIDPANLPEGLSMVPIGPVIVPLYGPFVADADRFWLFTLPNDIDGQCEVAQELGLMPDETVLSDPAGDPIVDPSGNLVVSPEANWFANFKMVDVVLTDPDGNIVTDPDGNVLTQPDTPAWVAAWWDRVLSDPSGDVITNPEGNLLLTPA